MESQRGFTCLKISERINVSSLQYDQTGKIPLIQTYLSQNKGPKVVYFGHCKSVISLRSIPRPQQKGLYHMFYILKLNLKASLSLHEFSIAILVLACIQGGGSI